MSNTFLHKPTRIEIADVNLLSRALTEKSDKINSVLTGDTSIEAITSENFSITASGNLTAETLQATNIKLTDTIGNGVELVSAEPTTDFTLTLPSGLPSNPVSQLTINPAGEIDYTQPTTLQNAYENGEGRDYGVIATSSAVGPITLQASATWNDPNEILTIENKAGDTKTSITGDGTITTNDLLVKNDTFFANALAGVESSGNLYCQNLQSKDLTLQNGKSLTFKSNSGIKTTTISAPTPTTNVSLVLPVAQANQEDLPLVSSTTGELSYNDQPLTTTSNFTCQDILVNGNISNTALTNLTAQVSTNSTDISTNTDGIDLNSSAINGNSSFVSTNATQIAQNTSDITDNKTAITANSLQLSSHTHTASEMTDFDTEVDARISLQKAQALGLATLDGGGKVPLTQLALNNVVYCGVWNASTNSPTLVSGIGDQGCYRVVSVSGTTNIDGINEWKQGDWIIFNGSLWEKSDHSDSVSSVNGRQGAVVIASGDIGITNTGSGAIITANERQQIINNTGSLKHKGFWNASTNTPELKSFEGNFGDAYIVSIAGSTNLNGNTIWKVNDWVYYDTLSQWRRLPYQTVSSVNGKTGEVVVIPADIGITNIGSASIITAQERSDINGSVIVHSDVSNAGSGAIITAPERTQITTNQTDIANLTTNVSNKTLQDAYNNSPNILTVLPVSLKTTTTNPVLIVRDASNSTSLNLYNDGSIFTDGNIESFETSQRTMKVRNAANTQRIGITVPAGLSTNYNLQLPQTLSTANNLPLISDTSGNLSYNDQPVLTTSDVKFNSVRPTELLYQEQCVVQTAANGGNITPITAQATGGWTFATNYTKVLLGSADINHAVGFKNSPANQYWNKLQYEGRYAVSGFSTTSRKFIITYNIDAQHLGDKKDKRDFGFIVAKNGMAGTTDAVYGSHSRVNNAKGDELKHFSATTIVELGPNDFVEVWAGNLSGQDNIDVATFSFVARALSNY